jgi:7-cyano-7-deazaguanine synthase
MKLAVLTSGGLDSTTLLYKAVQDYGARNVLAVNVNYGQGLIRNERAAAQYHARELGVVFFPVNAQSLYDTARNPLSVIEKDIPHTPYDHQARSPLTGAVPTYVPNRNMVLLSILGAVAIDHGISNIWYGAHSGDAADGAYPDCSEAFVEGMEKAFKAQGIDFLAPFIYCSKEDILRFALFDYDVPIEHTWSCYEGGTRPCGTCGTCRQREAAFEEVGTKDLSYDKDWDQWVLCERIGEIAEGLAK